MPSRVLVILSILGILIVSAAGGAVATQSLDDDDLTMYEELTGETEIGNPDTDDDGLKDGQELDRGTDPLAPDSDEDGLLDGAELNHGTDPTIADLDSDGLLDGEEVSEHGTDPTESDTDGDGLSDRRETEMVTDPTESDTDSDGVDDHTETTRLGTDPVESDTDSDGLTDGREHNQIGSDPTDTDTDDDGLDDGDEVTTYRTDPTTSDTDTDGLDDSREVDSRKLDPTDADSDDDLAEDGTELLIGTDPADPDTDDDGFQDGVEVSDVNLMEDANPLKKDIFVEVDYSAARLKPSYRSMSKLRRAFADAPVNNPNGERGIDLHFLGEGSAESSVPDSMSMIEYHRNVYRNSDVRQTTGYGFYHVMIVEGIEGGSANTVGVTHRSIDGMLVAKQDSPRTGSTIMHELGHNLGLNEDVYSGVDSQTMSWTAYPSAMNYNRPRTCRTTYRYRICSPDPVFRFSSGRGHDDWSYIANNLAANRPDTSRLRRQAS